MKTPDAFHCQDFYHKNENCVKKQICAVCAKEQQENACSKTEIKGINCDTANHKYKIKHETS